MSKYECGHGDPLDMLAEEMAELIKEATDVIKVIMKIKRFGPYNEKSPRYNELRPDMDPPIERLHQEIADVQAILDICYSDGVLDPNKVIEAFHKKNDRLKELFGEETSNVGC